MAKPNLFFSTPVWTAKFEEYEEVNNEIYKYIKKLQQNDTSGIIKSNIKGWHSKDFNLKENELQNFIKMISPKISEAIADMNWETKIQKIKIANMWAIINMGGAANSRHHHGNCTLSCAYYVKAPNNSGDIVFYDPRPAPVYSHPNSNGPNSLNAMVNAISPTEGGLVIFPSYLDHSVNENLSNEERIVISFNIILS